MSLYLTSLDIKDYKIYQDTEDYAFSQDSVFLANLATLSKDDLVIDLGCGCGILSFLAIIKKDVKKTVGIEVQNRVVEMTKKSIELNKLNDRFEIINGDVKDIKSLVNAESFDKALCNPPYFEDNKSIENNKKISRTESSASLDDFIKSASYALKFGGDLFIVYKVDKMTSLLSSLTKNNLEPKEITLVYPKLSKGVDIIIVKARKGAKPGLITKTLILKDEQNEYTKEYKELYQNG